MSVNYWSEDVFRPFEASNDAWTIIWQNFLSEIGDPATNLSTALAENLDKLEDFGFSDPSDFQALYFELEQAGDFGSIAEWYSTGSMGHPRRKAGLQTTFSHFMILKSLLKGAPTKTP